MWPSNTTPIESNSSFSVDDVSTTIHRKRSQRITSLPLRYWDNDNRADCLTTHSRRSQRNPELSPRISDDVTVSAHICVCNIYNVCNITTWPHVE